MSNGDVYPDDMNPKLSDERLEKLLAGRIDQSMTDHPVTAALTVGMETLRNMPAATPSQALSEFVGVISIPPTPIASPPAQMFDLRPRPARKRKTKMISSFAALVATTTGKLALGATVAAAAVGSAQVTGVVDVVPDLGNNVEVVAAGPAADDAETPIAAIPDAILPVSPADTEPVVPATESEMTDVDETDEAYGSMLNQTLVFPIDGVGSVIVVAVDGQLSMIAEAAAGWTVVVGDDPEDHDEAEVAFTDGTREVKVEAEIEHGALQITVKENGEKVATFFDENGNEIDKPVDDDDDSDHDDHDDDDSDHDDDDDGGDDDDGDDD